MSEQIDHANKVSLDALPLSVAIVDEKSKFVWFNQSFKNEFNDIALYGNSINLIADISLSKLLTGEKIKIKYTDKFYSVSASIPKEDESDKIYMIYIKNITKQVLLEIEKKMSQPVAMVIMIDNYDEMFEGILDSEKAQVTVKIDKLLEDFVAGTTGIMKKFNRDRVWAVIEQRHIDQLIEEKVKLLDKAREITVSERINVTLSIGIGTTAKNIAESEKFSRQALEMAQGRGGDQAAIKTATGFEFYGGVSKGIERQTKVKARIIANSLIEMVETADSIYIMGHKISDLDSIGASVGLACAIRNLNKNAYAVVDKTASLGNELIDRLKTTDYKTPLFILPSKAREMFTPNSLLIIVDTHNINLLDDYELYQKAEKVVVIDHHRKMVNHIDNAKIFHHEAYASSACEMITEMLQYFGTAGRLTALQAEAVLSGIMLDTKNFTIKTGVRTFEAAAFLRKLGADTINVKSLFSNSFDNYKQKVMFIASAKIHRKCAIASYDMLSEDMRLIAPQAADEMLSISNIDASFAVYRTTQNEIYISARSMGALNVQLIMEALGGGGHQTMAGAQLKDVSAAEVQTLLINAIDDYYNTLNAD